MDSVIRELKKKIVNLVTQLEFQKAEFVRRENAMVSTFGANKLMA